MSTTYIDDAKALTLTYYEVLGVEPTADTAEIKTAYKERLLNSHPDKQNGVNGELKNHENMVITIKEAYKALMDPLRRQEYDETLKKSFQKQGFNINGDGLDSYSLEDFEIVAGPNAEEEIWVKDCPRCTFPKSITLTEEDLEENGTDDGQGGFDIIVQCESCSLWIKVKYYATDEE